MYKIFKIAFIICMICSVVFLTFYFINLFRFINPIDLQAEEGQIEMNPFGLIQSIFTPTVLFFFIMMLLTQLTYMILGIVMVVRNKYIEGGEKAIWVIGFILFNFITAIVFMALNKTRHLAEGQPKTFPGYPHPNQ